MRLHHSGLFPLVFFYSIRRRVLRSHVLVHSLSGCLDVAAFVPEPTPIVSDPSLVRGVFVGSGCFQGLFVLLCITSEVTQTDWLEHLSLFCAL